MILLGNGSVSQWKNPNLFEEKCCLLDYCPNAFLERSIFCSVGIELDNRIDFVPLVMKWMIMSEPPWPILYYWGDFLLNWFISREELRVCWTKVMFVKWNNQLTPGLEPGTFSLRMRCSNHWATRATWFFKIKYTTNTHYQSLTIQYKIY